MVTNDIWMFVSPLALRISEGAAEILQKSGCHLRPNGEEIDFFLENRPPLFFNLSGGLFSKKNSISSPFGHKWHIDFCMISAAP